MKKLIFMCLVIAAMFANEGNKKEGIYDYFYKNEEKMLESLEPSLDDDFESSDEVAIVIACAASCGMATSPTIIFLDNFFTSYYHLIMQHTPKDKQQEVKRIAKEAMKKREYISKCSKEFTSSAGIQMCSHDYIGAAYEYGIQELSKYVSIHNPKLLDSIFLQYVNEVTNIRVEYDRAELLDKLYIDNIIDETGKLIIKVDSLGIFEYYSKNEAKMGELEPSFNCAKAIDGVEEYICFSASAGMAATPALILIDNLFTSYYKVIIQHTATPQKDNIRAIAKKAMKQRDSNFKNVVCSAEMSSAYCQILHNDSIFEAYSLGIRELSQSLAKTNPALLHSIFSNHTEQILQNGISEQILDSLYMDNIINETGKLIIKVDFK